MVTNKQELQHIASQAGPRTRLQAGAKTGVRGGRGDQEKQKRAAVTRSRRAIKKAGKKSGLQKTGAGSRSTQQRAACQRMPYIAKTQKQDARRCGVNSPQQPSPQ